MNVKKNIILESSRKCTIDLLRIKTNAFRILDHGNKTQRKRKRDGKKCSDYLICCLKSYTLNNKHTLQYNGK